MSVPCLYCEAELNPVPPPEGEAHLLACVVCMNPLAVEYTQTGPALRLLPHEQDLRSLLPPESLGGRLLAGMRERLDELPILPEVSQRVLNLLDDSNSSMKDLANIIREDAVIAANVLKVSNSAAYGGLDTVSELDAACTRLGLNSISNIVQTLAGGKLFHSDHPEIDRLMKKLWRHSVATALSANELAGVLALPRKDAIYLQGLFHDIGKVAVLDLIGSNVNGLHDELSDSPQLMHEILDRYHSLVGLHVMQRWNFAPRFLISTYFHATPDRVPCDSWLRPTHVVSLANKFAYLAGFGFRELKDELVLLDDPSTVHLKLTDIKLAGLRADLEGRLESFVGALQAA